MPSATTMLTDGEFGVVKIRRIKSSRYIRLRVGHDGALQASLPPRASLRLVEELINDSRQKLRGTIAATQQKQLVLTDGIKIGASHTMRVIEGASFSVKVKPPDIIVSLPPGADINSSYTKSSIRPHIVKALKVEAKAYLPRRLSYLANIFNFEYSKLRYSSAGTRWGSCSSGKTISLNIWLMQLPIELIDYVLIHELCHTKELNHSRLFWSLVVACDADYKSKRREMKEYRPAA